MQSSIQFDVVVGLARSQAAKFEHQHWFLVAMRPFAKRVLTYPLSVASSAATGVLVYLEKKFATQATVFRGIRVGLMEQPRPYEIDPKDEIRVALDKMELDLLDIRQSMFNLAQLRKKSGRPDGRFGEALGRLLGSISELFDEVRSCKGALQAHDANVCAASAGVGMPSTSDEALDSTIARLTAGQ